MNSERLRKIKKELVTRITLLKKQKEAIDRATKILRVRAKRLVSIAERFANSTGNNTPEREVLRLLNKNRNRNNNYW
jgi:hypothetical protein